MISIHIGIGMVLSLLVTETLGITAGGLIVPGYIALHLDDPIRLIMTFGVSILTYFMVKLLGKFILIYGKRRLVFTLLLGFLLGSIINYFSDNAYWNEEYVVIGNIIPGLIANWMDRQGVIRTISVIIIISTITRLIILTISLLI